MPGPGRPKDVSDEEILREVALARGPIVTAPELSDRLGISSSAVNKRLDSLVEEGYIKQREVGAKAIVYWLSEDGQEAVSSSE